MNDNIWERYKNKSIISSTHKAKVYKAKNKKTGKTVIIKEINKFQISNNIENYFIMKNINEENIVHILEIIETKDNYYVVMELCLFDLKQYIENGNRLSIEEIKKILLQLNNTIKIINQKKIIHGNIKPSNILFSVNQIEKLIPKLSDINLGKTLNLFISKSLDEFHKTLAPEVIEENFFSEKSDIWSLGITIYYMIFNEFPFEGKNEYIFLNEIKSNKNLKLCNNILLDDLLKKMLIVNKDKRISWDEYFNHDFFKINHDELGNFSCICKKHFKFLTLIYVKYVLRNILIKIIKLLFYHK